MGGPVYNFSSLPNSTGPEDPLTIRTLFQQALSKILGTALPEPLGNMASGWIGDFALKQMGIKYDYAMDVPLTTGGMSPRGVANNYLRTQISQIAPKGFEKAKHNAELQFWENIARIQKSEAQWAKEHGGFDSEAYSRYITAEAIGYQNGPASLIYNVTDPYDMGKAAPYMAMATSNLFNRQFMQGGDRRRSAQAVQFMNRLFTDESGERFMFDSKEYGGMGITEVSALTAALTKELDPLAGSDGSSQGLKNAVNQFRDRIKEYAEALSPLKDIFGQDIPSLLRTVEELSGRSIASTDAQQAKEIAMQVSTGTMYGNYTIGDVRGVNQRITQQMTAMGMSDMSLQQTALLSVDVLNAGTTNVPAFMRKDRLAQAAYDRVASSAGSMGAEYMDRAYALWAHNRRSNNTNADISVEAFENEFKGVAPQNMMRRALQVSGAANLVDLDRGMLYDEYQTAKNGRVGASMAAEIASRDLYESGMRSLINRFKDTSPDVANALEDLMGMTDDTDVNILDKTSVKQGLDKQGKIYTDAHAQAINVINAQSQTLAKTSAGNISAQYTIHRNMRLAKKERARNEQRLTLLKSLGMEGGPSGVKELLMEVIEGGLDFDSVKSRLAAVGITNEETAKDLVAVAGAMDTLHGIKSKDEWRNSSVQDLVRNSTQAREALGIQAETDWAQKNARTIDSVAEEAIVKQRAYTQATGKTDAPTEKWIADNVKQIRTVAQREAYDRYVTTEILKRKNIQTESEWIESATNQEVIKRVSQEETVRRQAYDQDTKKEKGISFEDWEKQGTSTGKIHAVAQREAYKRFANFTVLKEVLLPQLAAQTKDEWIKSEEGQRKVNEAINDRAVIQRAYDRDTTSNKGDVATWARTHKDDIQKVAQDVAYERYEENILYREYVRGARKIKTETDWAKTDEGKIAIANAVKTDSVIRQAYKQATNKVDAPPEEWIAAHGEQIRTVAQSTAYEQYVNKALYAEARDMSQFIMTAEGVGSRELNTALTAYQTAKNPEAKADASRDILIARLIGDETLSTYFGTDHSDDVNQRAALRNIVKEKLEKGESTAAVEEALKAKIEDTKLREVFKGDEGEKLLAAADKAASDAEGKSIGGNGDNRTTVKELQSHLKRELAEAKKNGDKDQQASITDQINKLNGISRQLHQGPVGSTDTMGILRFIEPIVAKLTDVLEELSQKLTRDGTVTANGTSPNTEPQEHYDGY